MNKIDLVLQGPLNEYSYSVAKHYLDVPFVNNIVISCWETNDYDAPLISNRIKIIRNKELENPGIGNRNRQILTSFVGLNQVETEFAVKLRSDQKISLESMQLMYDFYEQFKDRQLTYENDQSKPHNRICVAGMFRNLPFHPRDHLFWGNKYDLLELFDIPHDLTPHTFKPNYEKVMRAESYIGSHYCSKFSSVICRYIAQPKIYLVDKSPALMEAMWLSNGITEKIFKPFPKIELEWTKAPLTTSIYVPIKYGIGGYNYRLMEAYGEHWHEY